MKNVLIILFIVMTWPMFGQRMIVEQILPDILKDYQIYSINENHLNEIVLATNRGILVYDGENIRVLKQKNKGYFDYFQLSRKKDGSLYALDINAGIYKVGLDSIYQIHRYKKGNSSGVGQLYVDNHDSLVFIHLLLAGYKSHPEIKVVDSLYRSSQINSKVLGFNGEFILFEGKKIIEIKFIGTMLSFKGFYYFIGSQGFGLKNQTELPATLNSFKLDTLGVLTKIESPTFLNIQEGNHPSEKFIYYTDSNYISYLYSGPYELFDTLNIKDVKITTGFTDHNNREWFGSFQKGLFKISNLQAKRYQFKDELLGIETYQNKILISTENNDLVYFSDEKFKFHRHFKSSFIMKKMISKNDLIIIKTHFGDNIYLSNKKICLSARLPI